MKNNAKHILSLSYGKDSIACLFAIEQLGLPLDGIVHAEVWATDDIPADLPEMVEFKKKADKIIKDRWGIEVEHIYAMKHGEKNTYEKEFYSVPDRADNNKSFQGTYLGFPFTKGSWCNDRLKLNPMSEQKKNGIIHYLGIASDEPERIERQKGKNVILPLVEIGWDEAYCRKICEENDLLSPIYTSTSRGGCWFCHKQPIEQLRLLRKNHPELWDLLLKWDLDSPVSFRSDGHTVHDLDKRFYFEDKKLIPASKKFRWKMLEDIKQE